METDSLYVTIEKALCDQRFYATMNGSHCLDSLHRILFF